MLSTAHDAYVHMETGAADQNRKKEITQRINAGGTHKTIKRINLPTWISPNGQQQRQKDYVSIKATRPELSQTRLVRTRMGRGHGETKTTCSNKNGYYIKTTEETPPQTYP